MRRFFERIFLKEVRESIQFAATVFGILTAVILFIRRDLREREYFEKSKLISEDRARVLGVASLNPELFIRFDKYYIPQGTLNYEQKIANAETYYKQIKGFNFNDSIIQDGYKFRIVGLASILKNSPSDSTFELHYNVYLKAREQFLELSNNYYNLQSEFYRDSRPIQ